MHRIATRVPLWLGASALIAAATLIGPQAAYAAPVVPPATAKALCSATTVAAAMALALPAGYTPVYGTPDNDERLRGSSGNEVIWGFGGNDNLRGGGGDDILCGGDGEDRLRAGSGENYLIGGVGDGAVDRLRGGGGVDLFFAEDLDKVSHRSAQDSTCTAAAVCTP